VKPEINAICTIMIAAVALGLVIAALIAKRARFAHVNQSTAR
jgi:ABC-type spermidine/putrescine transport system permease subunit II